MLGMTELPASGITLSLGVFPPVVWNTSGAYRCVLMVSCFTATPAYIQTATGASAIVIGIIRKDYNFAATVTD